MAPSKSQYHVRSNSFPTRPHPLLQQCDEYLRKLVVFDSNSSSSSSSSTKISHKLSGLEDLHECVEKLFQLPLTQQAFVRGRGEKWVDELVDGSLRLLDACSSSKDAVLHTKECAREVQSNLRRRRRLPPAAGLVSEVEKYFASRKVVKKAIRKALDKVAPSKSATVPSNKDDVETMALVGVLREVEEMTLAVFESLLCFVSGTKTKSQLSRVSGWGLVSKLVQKKKVGCDELEEATESNEFAKVDEALQGLDYKSGKFEDENASSNNNVVFEGVQIELRNLESCVQDFEERLERLFRRLIKTRVSLLNILNY